MTGLSRAAARRAAGLAPALVAAVGLSAHPWRPAPHVKSLLRKGQQAHGGLAHWDPIRDLRIQLTRKHYDEKGRVHRREEETIRLLKGRRPRILLEAPTESGWRVYGFDGHRSWATVNGYQVRGEAIWGEAEERTRRQLFVNHLPFILSAGDATGRIRSPGTLDGHPTEVAEVRFRKGTWDSETTFLAHFDRRTCRLVRLEFDDRRTPGSHHSVTFSRHSSIAGVWMPFVRTWRRSDGAVVKVEELSGVAVNECPPTRLFCHPGHLPRRRGRPSPPIGRLESGPSVHQPRYDSFWRVDGS